jgi:RNA polymerase sigma-32 factor
MDFLAPAYSALLRKQSQPLTREEEVEVVRKAKAGDKAARDRLLLANMRMAVKVALSFRAYGVPLEDLTHAAVEGMFRALAKFQPERGLRFFTYATHWMMAYVRNHLAQREVLVRSGAWGQVRANAKRLIPEVRGRHVLSFESQPATSAKWAGPEHDGQSATLGEKIDDRSLEDADDVLVVAQRDSDIRARLARMRETLSPIERDLLANRLMVDHEDRATLEEIAARNPVAERQNGWKVDRPTLTRERVRQIEMALKRRLRNVLEDLRDAA